MGEEAKQILNDAEDELRAWQPTHEPIHSNAGGLGSGAVGTVPQEQVHHTAGSVADTTTSEVPSTYKEDESTIAQPAVAA